MKFLAIFLVVLSVVLSVVNADECPAVYVQGEEHYLPHENCHHFYQCIDGGNKALLSCPTELLWNPTKNVCDWPADCGCTGDRTEIVAE